MCIDRCAAFALCINVIVCICAAILPEAISVFFCIYMWLICWSLSWTAHSCIYRRSPWSSDTQPVFTDSWPDWTLPLFSLLFLSFLFSVSNIYVLLLYDSLYHTLFSLFFWLFFQIFTYILFPLSISSCIVLVLISHSLLFLFLSVSYQSVGLVWTTRPSYHPGPPWFQVAVKVLEGSAAEAAVSWEGARDTTATTRLSPTPSTTWPNCHRPTRRSWNQNSTATAPWRSWVSSRDGEGCIGRGGQCRQRRKEKFLIQHSALGFINEFC